ncbi:MAG TPA: HAD family phosphatase [Bryobacteraceae bacterium]|jgi:HAD superfamily hydrolase (TIGR01509 family)|nr:HAD family phosphatase [Bryobacteraceae bacterium]
MNAARQRSLRSRPLALIFDLDGVLLDSAPSHNRAFEEVFRPFGIHNFDYTQYAGWKTAPVIEDVLRGAGLEPTPQLILELADQKSRLAREELRRANPIAQECVPMLVRLSQSYSLALASSGSRPSIELFLSLNECAHLFQSVLCGDDVSCAKPHPEIYQRTFAKLDVDPQAALVVEDAVAGIQAARAANVGAVVGVEGTCTASQLAGAGANEVIRAVSELPRFLYDTYESGFASESDASEN